MMWVYFLIVIGSVLLVFFAVVQFGVYLKQNRRKYPLPEQKAFVRDTEAGKMFAVIASGRCPHCKKATRFIAGPRGGMSQNIQCETCGWWFNATAFSNGEGVAESIGFKSASDNKLGKPS